MADFNGIISASYDYYKRTLVASDGRPLADKDVDDLDKDSNTDERITFSEGASYVLLRAVEMNDQQTFNRVWSWTQKNLQRKNIARLRDPAKRDNLFAWRYVPGRGVLDSDPASDADQDIAAALIKSHQKWGSSGRVNYQREAQLILNDIWDKETRVVAGKRVLIGSDVQIYTRDPMNGQPTVGVNPSYFRPEYYGGLFAAFDTGHQWSTMVDPAYEIIEKAADATLHDDAGAPIQGKVNLIPDWVALDSSFNIRDHGWKQGDHAGRNDFYAGGDAFRLSYWMALRLQSNPNDQFARRYFTDNTGTPADIGPRAFYNRELKQNGTIYAGYKIDGVPQWSSVTLQSLSGYLVYFWAAGDTAAANKILEKIQSQYNTRGFWQTREQDFYYSQNWVWFAYDLVKQNPRGIVLSTAPALASLPIQFDKQPMTPKALIEINSKKNAASLGRERTLNDRIAHLPPGATFKLPPLHKKIFFEHVLRWILRRENGDPGADAELTGSSGLRDGHIGNASPYWKTKVAYLIVAGRPTQLQLDFLAKLFPGLTLSLKPTNAERLAALRRIADYFVKAEGTKADPLLRGQIETDIVLIAKADVPDSVKQTFDQVTIETVKRRMEGSAREINDELTASQGSALAAKARILLYEAGRADKSAEVYKKLADAYKLLMQAADKLDGIHLVQVKQLAAECLVRLAFILKDEGKEYRRNLRQADALITGVLDWAATYNAAVADPASRSLWLKQISVFARLIRANTRMVEIGEDRGKDESPHQYLERQRTKLIEVETDKGIEPGKENGLRNIILPAADQILIPEEVARINRLLAENLARQGFITMDLRDGNFTALFDEAKKLLEKNKDSVIANGNAESKAEAALWLAKIALVEAGGKSTEQQKTETLAKGVAYIQQALIQTNGKYLLTMSTLSSALQTRGDLLSARKNFQDAAAYYRRALDVFAKNYYARAALGDALNWLGDYAGAKTEYEKIPAVHPAYKQARLGLAEVEMRQGEKYEPESIKKLEELVRTIVSEEARGSYLSARAVEALIEAWGTNENLQDRIILLGNALLGLNHQVNPDAEINGLLQALKNNLPLLPPRLKAKLYLKTAESISYLKGRRAEAGDLLARELPADLQPVIDGDPALRALQQLLLKELEMKNNRAAKPMQDSDLEKIVRDSKDPDLIMRLIFDRLDGLTFEQKYAELIALARQGLAQFPTDVLPLLRERNRELSLSRYRLQLRQRLADALSWKQDYAAALTEYGNLESEAQGLASRDPGLALLYRSRALVGRGDIYLYQEKYDRAVASYTGAIKAIEESGSQKSDYIKARAWALYGLGEVYRYGEKDYREAKNFYLKALAAAEFVSARADDRADLLAKIYLGLTLLELAYGDWANRNYSRAAGYITLARDHLERIEFPLQKLAEDIKKTDAAVSEKTLPALGVNLRALSGSDGRAETQTVLSVDLIHPKLSFLHLLFNEQIDSGNAADAVTAYSTYAGLRLFPHSTLSLEAQYKIPAWPSTTPAGLRLTRRPDWMFSLFWWHPDITVSGSANINTNCPPNTSEACSKMNTYYAAVMANAAGRTEAAYLKGLRLGVESSYMYFPFYGDLKERLTLALGGRYEAEVAPWLKLRANLLGLVASTREEIPGLQPYWRPGWGVDAGGGGQIMINQHLQLDLGTSYQFTPEYSIFYFQGGLALKF